MNKRTLFIIFILIFLVLLFSVAYNKRINIDNKVTSDLRNHHTALLSIVGYIEKYNKDINNIDKLYIKSLLMISKEFELSSNSYNEAYNKKIKNNGSEKITTILNNYFNLFVKSVSLINEVDYDSLNTIKNDLNKWGEWIEDNYIYTDKNGYTAYRIYTFDDMIKGGLLDELTLADFNR